MKTFRSWQHEICFLGHFFAQGIRIEEKLFWQHEWLESLVDREESIESSDYGSSDLERDQREVSDKRHRSIQMWQNGVVAHSS